MATRPWEELAPGYDLRPAWRLDDAGIEADAVAFWLRLGILPSDVTPEERAKELTAVAYKDGLVVGVHTIVLARLEIVRARLAMMRSAVDPEHRRGHVSMALSVYTRELLERWSLEHPEERLAGLGAIIEGPNLFDRAREPFWPNTRFGVVGYTKDGRQVRVSWFDHFRYEGEDGQRPVPAPPVAPELVRDVELREAWRRNDTRIEADAIDFWGRLGILPADVTPRDRAKDIVFAVYKGDRIVGLSTAELGVLPQVRARLAMVRGAVDPEFRRSHIGTVMLLRTRQALESWSAENPHERVAGLGAILESHELAGRQLQPYAELSKMGLVGFTPDGRQIRVSWFEDFRLD